MGKIGVSQSEFKKDFDEEVIEVSGLKKRQQKGEDSSTRRNCGLHE
jgi:hypothetical protein